MRDDVLIRLTDRVMTDAGFRSRARADLDGALRAEGFDLTDEELAAVREFHRQTADLSDAELTAALTDTDRRQFAT
jgi:hypothetical protein